MQLSVDPASPVPLHHQAEALLRSMTRDPAYQSGELLPPETDLARRLGISRSTLRAAIDRLVQDGLLVRRRGHGTRVTSPGKRRSKLESWESFTRELAAQGLTAQTFEARFRPVKASRDVALALNIDQDTKVYLLERVRGCENRPAAVFQSWFHPRLNLQGDEVFDRPLYELLEEWSGIRPEHSHESLSAVTASSRLARQLGVVKGAPLLRRVRRVTDPGGRPVEYAVNHYRSDRFDYTVDIRRGNV